LEGPGAIAPAPDPEPINYRGADSDEDGSESRPYHLAERLQDFLNCPIAGLW